MKYYLVTMHEDLLWVHHFKTIEGLKKNLENFLEFYKFIEEQNIYPEYNSIKDILNNLDKHGKWDICYNGNGSVFKWGEV